MQLIEMQSIESASTVEALKGPPSKTCFSLISSFLIETPSWGGVPMWDYWGSSEGLPASGWKIHVSRIRVKRRLSALLPAIPPIVGRLEDDVLDSCTCHVSRRLDMLNVSQDSLPSITQADARSPHLVEGAAGLLLAAKALEVGGRRVSHGLDMFRNRLSRPVYSHSLGWHAGLAGLLRTLDASSAQAWLAANRAQLGRRLDLGTSSPAHTARGVWGAEHGLGALDLSLRRLSIDVCKSVLGEAVL